MSVKEHIANLLEELQEYTGIPFSIPEEQMQDDTILTSLENVLAMHRNKDTRQAFLWRYLSAQASAEDIAEGIHRYRIEESGYYLLFLLESKHIDSTMRSVIHQLLVPSVDSVFTVDTHRLLILRQLTGKESAKIIEAKASRFIDTIEAETMCSCSIAYDVVPTDFHALPQVYHAITSAMEIGKTFYPSLRLYNYRDLGLGKLLYHLPKEACEEYLRDHLGDISFSDMDKDTLSMIHTFFDNNLSLAETARKLYLHRNTLIYRIDKFQDMTGLDLRNFNDAVTCKVAMLLHDYLQ